jgi:branched-chain amino acid transport system substrate-binding protein
MDRRILAAVVLVPLLVLACADSKEIRIGFAGPKTGENAQTGKAVYQGVQLAVDQWNASGGTLGKKAVLFEADDGSDPAKAVEAANKLCRDRVLVVVGHVDSGCTLKARPVYFQSGVVMITPTSTHPDVTDLGEGKVFRVCGRDDAQGREAAVWVIRQKTPGPLVVLNDGSPYGERLAREFQDNFEFLSGAKAALSEVVAKGTTDFEPLVAKVGAAAPGVIYFGGLGTQGGSLLKALRAAGVKGLFIAGDGCFGDEFLTAAGLEAAEGARMTFAKDPASLPATRPIVEAYREKYGDPGPYALFGFAAARIALEAAAESVPPLNERSLRDAMHRLQFKTVFGLAKFDDKGDITENPYIVWRVEGGKFWECRELQPPADITAE